MKNKRHGFTLVEMSIVLVIVGLLAAGIVVGQTLIRQSQIRNVMGEIDSNIKAFKEFQDKYMALPGDMNNAESYWGSDTSGGGTCPNIATNTTPKKTTCNGTGTGTIAINTGAACNTVSTEYESFRAWQHLANAGFISGQYPGVTGSGSSWSSVPGTNVPRSTIPAIGTEVFYLQCASGGGVYWGMNYGHIFNIAGQTSGASLSGAVFTPTEALDIDTKLDDGKPGYGKVVTVKAARYANCTTSDTQSSSAYNTSYASLACGLTYITGF